MAWEVAFRRALAISTIAVVAASWAGVTPFESNWRLIAFAVAVSALGR